MRIIQALIFLVVFVAIVGGLSLSATALILHTEGYRLLSVQTGSMAPTFSAGDALIVRQASVGQLQIGDIISYHSPANSRVIVSHRLMAIDYLSGKLTTKGDHIKLSDISFPASLLIGKVIKIVPLVGYGMDWLHQPSGLIVLIYMPAAFILVSEAKRLAHNYEKPAYCVVGYKSLD